MKTIITIQVVFDKEKEADRLIDAISNLDDEGMFPTGADVRKTFDYQWAGDKGKYKDIELAYQDKHHA